MSSITVNRRVLQKLIPIAIGYLALGIACGILAQQAGLTPLEALGMSVLVFAGSGQFIGIAMMARVRPSFLSDSLFLSSTCVIFYSAPR